MSNAMYYIVFIAGLACTSSHASAELERAGVASGMMRRETKHEIEVTAHAFAQSTVPKAAGDTNQDEKVLAKHDGEDAGKSATHHKSHHHHHHGHHHKHGHHHHSKHAAKVKELEQAGPNKAAKEKTQKKDAEHAKDVHSKGEKHPEKKAAEKHSQPKTPLAKKTGDAAHTAQDSALDHIAKESNHAIDHIAKKESDTLDKDMHAGIAKPSDKTHGHDEKHPAQKTAVPGPKAHALAKGTTHAETEKQHDKKNGHDEKHLAQKPAMHDAKHIAKESPQAHTLAKGTKHADTEKQHDKKGDHDEKHLAQKAAVHSGTKHTAKELLKENAHTHSTGTKHAHTDGKESKDEKDGKGAKRVQSLTAAEDAGHIRELGDSKQDASTLEEIAKEVESLHLTESELDPDENYHAHKHEAFQVKVTGPEGHELCLSEVHSGYAVRAVKCSPAHSQHWYWEKQQLKTLKSKERCLGFMSVNGHQEHQLAMYPCVDAALEISHQGWKMDEQGRLRSLSSERCMAFDDTADKKMNAITLLCDDP